MLEAKLKFTTEQGARMQAALGISTMAEFEEWMKQEVKRLVLAAEDENAMAMYDRGEAVPAKLPDLIL